MDFNDIALVKMGDLSVILFRVCRIVPRAAIAAALVTIGCGLGGCAGGAASNSFAMASNTGGTTIAWVWDVYDQNQQRALRLSGEEQAGKAGRDAWSSADDLVLRKIAQSGLSGLAGMINGTPPADAPQPAPPSTPSRRGPAVASAEDSPAPREGEFAVGPLGYGSH